MYQLNKKLKDLIPYEPIQGEYKIRLDANESCFDLGDDLKDKLCEEIKKLSFNRYPDPFAKEAVKAFADYYNLEEKYITAGNGSDELISIISSTFLETGDKVVTLSQDFSMYAFYGSIYETQPLVFEKNEDLIIDVSGLVSFCNENNAKMLIFSNPCNPTSIGLDRKNVEKLLDGINKKCLVVLDEAYMDFWNESLLDSVSQYDNLMILKTCSKAIGLAGIRMGFAVANEKITNAMRAVKSPYNTDIISQKTAEVVFKEKALLDERTARMVEGRNELYKACVLLMEVSDKIEKIYESATNFVFIKTDYADEIFESLLEKSIAVRKFKGYLRISTGTEEENAELINVLREII
ncbi:MAG: histidinol-phosphate aminotransferase family protein [Ruminococcus sp.]|nr:histidinol-phosphate aminotransferase family protein [Ruminococcus sp.]